MGPIGADPLLILLCALFLDVFVGDMPWLFRVIRHPVVWLGALIERLDQRLNRETRSGRNRMMRGALVVCFVVGVSWGVGWGISWLTAHYPFGWLIEFFFVLSLIAQRSLYDFVKAVAEALETEGLQAGRRAVGHIVGRDPAYLDQAGVARAAIESLAENFSDAVIAPVFWYVLFGIEGLLIYKAVNTMDSMIGHLSDRHKDFGFTAARLDDILNLIPARLSGLWIILASAWFFKMTPWMGLKVMIRDARNHRSPNAGWPESAMAGCLGLSLAGPRRYRAGEIVDPWIGSGRQEATAADIRAALKLYGVACMTNAMAVFALYLF